MSFDIPNLADTAFPEQARPYSSDFSILTGPFSLSGVKTGCAVTAQGSPNMTVAVAAGTIYWLGAEVAVTAGNVTITTANASNPRIDLVVASSTGVKSAIAGTPAVIPTAPAAPALGVVLAQVVIPANDTTIGATQIRDRRLGVPIQAVTGSTMVRKTADESVASSTTIQDDNHLFFAMTPNNRYAVKLVLQVFSATVAGIRANWSAPTGAVWRFNYNTFTSVITQSSDGTGADLSLGAVPAINVGWVQLAEGIVTTSATAGNLQFRWAQQTSNAIAMTLLTNSYLEYRPLP